jgi:ribose transport system substrate-binding protein
MKTRTMRIFQVAAVASTLATSALAYVGTTATAASAAKKYTIGFVVGAEADPFFQSMYVGASAEAAKLGVNLIWQGSPTEYSPSTQIPFVTQTLAMKPNALVLGPTDTKALEPYVKQAVKSGVKVFNVDSGDANQKNITAWVTGNNVQGGQTAADALASALSYSTKCTASSKCYVAVGVSSISTSTDAARMQGFNQELKAKYPNIVALSPVVSNSQPSVAQSGFAQDISAHKLAGIFAIDGTDAEGATAAVTAAKKSGKIKIVGYDAYASNITEMQAGLLTAIISQQPALEGKLIIKYAVEALEGKKVPHLTTLANQLLTASSSASLISKYQYVAA